MTPTRQTLHAEDIYSWRRVWRTPIGVFIIMMVVALGTLSFAFSYFVQDIGHRRQERCQAENVSSQRQRTLWEGIIKESQENPDAAYVVFEGTRYPVIFEDPNDDKTIKRVREFIQTTYPITKC